MTSNTPTQGISDAPQRGAGNTCLVCGLSLPPQTAPELCPRCLLVAGLRGSAQPPSEREIAENRRFGPYQLGKLLGHGGMGEVYEADDLETGRRVALKILSQRLDSPAARHRFLNEGRITATINHPHSVYVFGAEEVAGVPVIAMELMPGGTLEDKLRSAGPLPVTDAVDIALQIIDGLAAAHAAGILHRDIKPSNCFLDTDGSVKIGDYGLSISIKGHERSHAGDENFIGTPAFAAPEQLRGEDLTVRSDIYSLGATLFVLLTGKLPHEAKSPIRLLAKVLESPAPDLRELRPGIPKGLANAVSRCLEKRPDGRFAGCRDLQAVIAPFSSRGKSAAQPWQRLFAGTMDMAMVGIPFLILSRMISNTDQGLPGLVIQTVLLLCAMLAWITWFTLFEWKFGRTPGKAQLGLDVRPANPGQNPWIAGLRILGRSSLFVILPITAVYVISSPIQVAAVEKTPVTMEIFGHNLDGTQTRTHYEWKLDLTTIATWTAATFLLFAGAHRRNGWLALHDSLSGTRVVSPVRREPPLPMPGERANLPVPGTPMFGPFHILATVSGTDDWQIGYDPKLLRKIWLRKMPSGSHPVAPALRNLRRPGRLRWLAGVRSPGANWDAYEYPGGCPLASFATTRVPWHQLHKWMANLATELTAAATDGTQATTPTLDKVWITAAGRAKLLDFPAPGVHELQATAGRSFWFDLSDRLLEHRPHPLPVSAFLRSLPGREDPGLLSRELEDLATVPHEVTRAKRFGVIASSAAGPLLLGLAMWFFKGITLPTALFWSLAALIAFVALPAIATAALAGDGLILRTMGMCVVDRHGIPANAALASRRSLIAWLPTLASPALFAALMVWLSAFTAAAATLAILTLLAMVSAMLPERTIHDRLAGTWLVPR
jgi:eukaryotic-like serine/threonine-protein kinase